MESNIAENVILIDWLSFTSKKHSPEELIAAMGLGHLTFTELDTGINGYNCRLYFDHIHVCYNGGNNDHGGMGVNVFMSSQGCRVFESNTTLKNKWMDLFHFIFANKLNICRLDVAYDDHSGLLDTLFGFTFSFWEVFCFVIVAGIIAYILGGFFSGD